MRSPTLPAAFWAAALLLSSVRVYAEPITLQIDAGHVSGKVSPLLYGLMTEEINYSYDGGLYGELVRNRTFQDNAQAPEHWSLVQEGGSQGALALDRNQPLNAALPVSLRLDAAAAGAGRRVGIANDGFWGIPARPNTTYRASFYAKASPGFAGTLAVSIESDAGSIVRARAEVASVGPGWKHYAVTLTTGAIAPSAANHLVIATDRPGTVWFDLVSLFPPTWNDRPNGNRMDIMQLLADLHPAFLRFPGGNYVEGRTIATRFDWKRTLGDLAERPGHLDDAWHYRSSDGMGLLEFLEWCEDLHMQPVLAVFAGLTLDRQAPPVAPGAELQPFVQDALDEIEYVSGDASTKWGSRRAENGHPAPFALHYVEIGNEDNFDRKPGSYDGRFTQFFDAIKAKHPELNLIATAPVTNRQPDVQDDHYYRTAGQMESDTRHYDATNREGKKIFVGEWATREGVPTPNLNAALGDAAWLTGLERDSDIVIMSCYAPLFVNVNPGGMQWKTDLIGYDALRSYGSPSYYVQKMFNLHHGDEILAATAANIPAKSWQPPKPRGAAPDAPAPPAGQEPALFFNATRDSHSGQVFVKFVNTLAAPQTVRVAIAGGGGLAADGLALTLASAQPEDTNSIDAPTKIVPVETRVAGLGAAFTYTFAPYSVTIL
ncbi:MAG TPA: alpha-L-arabinofuranosidase C-terminal domain-containing protein, partial [Opitutaceae bacterium]|nr:alpha-L-arabinofuranosidase C-terminal domain-containing protein [Opitutaceae bacterium]